MRLDIFSGDLPYLSFRFKKRKQCLSNDVVLCDGSFDWKIGK